MSTQPTNLPVPSESPRDLKFNAGKIDEFVTSKQREYEDRFGNKHYTVEGLRWVAQQAISAFGYITLKSFQLGAPLPNNELTLPNQVLQDENDGEYYRWDGAFPKQVPAGSTPQSTGGVGVVAWVSVGDASARKYINENFKHKITQLAEFSDISTYSPLTGEIVEIDGKQFLTSDSQSMNTAVPTILFGNGKYAIPHKGTVTGLAYRFDEDAYITNPALDSTNNYQGLEADTVAGSVFYSRVTTPGATLETCTLYEQAFDTTTMTAGAILKTVANVPMGHGDYFAVVRNADGTRTILFGKPQAATFGVTKIAKMDWDVSTPVSTVTDLLDFTGSQYPVRTNITWGTEGQLVIHAVNRSFFMCDAIDVLSGVFKPLDTIEDITIANAACIVIPSQNVKRAPVGDLFYFASGVNVRRTGEGYLGICDSYGNQNAIQALKRTYSDANSYELETVTWMWDANLHRYKTVIGVYDFAAAKITLSSVDSGDKNSSSLVVGPGYKRVAATDQISPQYQGQSFLQQWPGRIGAEKGICPGSISISSVDLANFNPFLFQIHNFAHGEGNRYGSRIRYGVSTTDYAEVLIDGAGDAAVGKGIRLVGSNWDAIAAFAPDGITFGSNRTTAIGTKPLAMLNVTSSTSRVAIRASASTVLPAFHNASNGPTLTGTTAFALGLYDESTLVYKELLRGTATNYTWTVPAASARWLKEDFDYTYVKGLEFINALKPLAYTWKDSKQRRIGFIADEVPDELAIGLDEETGKPAGIWDTAIIAHLVKAVQQLSKEVEELKRLPNSE